MEPSPLPGSEAHLPVYQRIAASLRKDILSGKYPAGTLLATTEEISAEWKTSFFTAHTALKVLVKEGWLDRLQGHGTYVVHPEKRFVDAGIYHSLNIWSDEEATFQRRVNDCLVEGLQRMGKNPHIFVDSRPEPTQDDLFPALGDAIFNRRIQCLIAPSPNSKSLPILSKVAMPVAFVTSKSEHFGVKFDAQAFLRGSIRSLKEQGCRSIGLISNQTPIDSRLEDFTQEAAAAGLLTRPEWTIQPSEWVPRLIEYGFHSFRKLWNQKERPDGLLVYPDTVARGIITAVLHFGVRVPGQMKFVFHRNLSARLLCPFPVTWAVSDERAVAAGLIQIIQDQFAGKKPAQVVIPYSFEKDEAGWLN